MTAWMVINVHVHDSERFASAYAPATARLAEAMGGTYILRGRGGQILEGEGRDGASAVVIAWPDRDAAMTFWNSPEYADIKKLRDGLADVTVTLVEG